MILKYRIDLIHVNSFGDITALLWADSVKYSADQYQHPSENAIYKAAELTAILKANSPTPSQLSNTLSAFPNRDRPLLQTALSI
jgi:hypothetical protein